MLFEPSTPASCSTPGWNGSSTPDAIRTGIPLNEAACEITSPAANADADANAPAFAARACV